MLECERNEGASTAMMRQLRLLIRVEPERDEAASRWRDDLRLFALAWTAGFVFFLVMLA